MEYTDISKVLEELPKIKISLYLLILCESEDFNIGYTFDSFQTTGQWQVARARLLNLAKPVANFREQKGGSGIRTRCQPTLKFSYVFSYNRFGD